MNKVLIKKMFFKSLFIVENEILKLSIFLRIKFVKFF